MKNNKKEKQKIISVYYITYLIHYEISLMKE